MVWFAVFRFYIWNLLCCEMRQSNWGLTHFTSKMKFTFRSLSHENILQFVGFHNEKEKKKLWLITEFVDGGSMRRFCKKQQKDNNTDGVDEQLTLDKKLYIATCCWRGLDYLHSNNVCHKDISPDNILVTNIYICLFTVLVLMIFIGYCTF